MKNSQSYCHPTRTIHWNTSVHPLHTSTASHCTLPQTHTYQMTKWYYPIHSHPHLHSFTPPSPLTHAHSRNCTGVCWILTLGSAHSTQSQNHTTPPLTCYTHLNTEPTTHDQSHSIHTNRTERPSLNKAYLTIDVHMPYVCGLLNST